MTASELVAAGLGAAVRARRIELGLSQEELSDQLGLTRPRLSALENGRTGQVRLLIEVCIALGLELVALPRDAPATAPLVHAQRNLIAHRGRRYSPSRSSEEQRG